MNKKDNDERIKRIRKIIPDRKGLHYRKMSHGLYVVWLFGDWLDFENSRDAKQLFRKELKKLNQSQPQSQLGTA